MTLDATLRFRLNLFAAFALLALLGLGIPQLFQQPQLPPSIAPDAYYIPAGSDFSTVSLNGVAASLRGDASSILFRIETGKPLVGCVISADAKGLLSVERVNATSRTLACVFPDGRVGGVDMVGYAVDPDGKVGLRAALITRASTPLLEIAARRSATFILTKGISPKDWIFVQNPVDRRVR